MKTSTTDKLNEVTYEECARCGYDHDVDSAAAQEMHATCEICAKEMKTGLIGDSEDHFCTEHQLHM